MQPPDAIKNPILLTPVAPRSSEAATKGRVFLIGATISSATVSARRAGLAVTGLDAFGDLDTRRHCDRFATFDDWSAEDGWGAFDHWVDSGPAADFLQVGGLRGAGSRFLKRMAGRRRSLGPTEEQLRVLGDPCWLRDTALACGLWFPQTILPSSSLQDFLLENRNLSARSHVSDRLGVPAAVRWLRKAFHPTSPSAGGLGVRWADQRQAFEMPVQDESLPCELLQGWVPGRRWGATYFGDGSSACLLGVCRSSVHRLGSLPFVYAGSFGPIAVSPSSREQLRRLGKWIVQQSGLRGIFGVDLIVGPHAELTLLEINARWTASSELIESQLLRRGCVLPGDSLIGAVAARASATAMEEALASVAEAAPPTHLVHWKRIVYAAKPGVLQHSLLPAPKGRLLERQWDDGLQLQISDLPPNGRHFETHEPILTLVFTVEVPRGATLRFPWPICRRLVAAVQAAVI